MKVLIGDQLLEYKDEGSGKVLLFLHGWGTNLGTFDKLAGYLAKNYRVIRIDFPGFGQSPKPRDTWGVKEYAQITSDFLDKIKIDDIYAIISHSFGGRVTIKGVSSGLFSPEKVILIGSAGVKTTQSLKKGTYKLLAKSGKVLTSLPLVRKLQPALRGHLYSAAGSTDYLQANHMQKIFINVINEDLLPAVSKITQPTLLIWGVNDTETPLVDARKILQALPSGRLVAIPGAGHFVYSEAYDSVSKEIDGFLL